MTGWILVVVIVAGGLTESRNAREVRLEPMPEAQCRAMLQVFSFVKGVGVACVGPNGELILGAE
jgi:hypothetical protein